MEDWIDDWTQDWIDEEEAELGKIREKYNRQLSIIYRKLQMETQRFIYQRAELAPNEINLKDARELLYRYDRVYYPIWYDAYKPKLTQYAQFWLLIEIYSAEPPHWPIPKRGIIALKRIKPADYLKYLDKSLENTDPITVYRGGSTDPAQQRTQLSWTTDPKIAIWFAWRSKSPDKQTAVWQATITKDKIIATTEERGEKEVLQHCGVKNIKELNLTEEQIIRAVNSYNKEKK